MFNELAVPSTEASQTATEAHMQINFSKKNKHRSSALYHFLKQNPDLIAPHEFKFSANRAVSAAEYPQEYLLIQLDTKDESMQDLQNIGLTILGHHLRIDAIYNEIANAGINTMAFAHISIKTRSQDNLIYKFRIYTNSYGKQLCCVCTKYAPLSLEEPGVVVEVNAMQATCIAGITEVGKNLLKNLIACKDAHCQQALTHANTMEEKLQLQFAAYVHNPDQQSWQAYQAQANIFIDAINNVNLYAENYIDQRGKFITNTLQQLAQRAAHNKIVAAFTDQQAEQAKEQKPTSSADEERALIAASASPAVAKEPIASAADLEYRKLTELMEQFQHHASLASLTNADAYLAAHNLTKPLQLQILFCLDSNGLSAEQLQNILMLSQQIEPFTSLAEPFQQAVISNNINAVTAIYPYVYNKIDIKFYLQYLQDLLDSKDAPNLAVCEFFYNSADPLYEIALRLLNIKIFNTDIEHMLISSLTKAAIQPNKMPMFAMLLDHGIDPNHTACIYDLKTIPLLSYVIWANHSDTIKHTLLPLQLKLIASGALVEYPKMLRSTLHKLDPLRKTAGKQISMERFLSKAGVVATTKMGPDHMSAEKITMNSLSQQRSALAVMAEHARTSSPELVAALLANTSLTQVAIALVNCADQTKVTTRIVHASGLYQVHSFANMEHCNANFADLFRQPEYQPAPQALRLSYIYIGDDVAKRDNTMANIALMVYAFKQKYAAVREKYPQQINQISKELKKQADQYANSALLCLAGEDLKTAKYYHAQARHCYQAIILLLTMLPEQNAKIIKFLCQIYATQAHQHEVLASHEPCRAEALRYFERAQYLRHTCENVQKNYRQAFPATPVLPHATQPLLQAAPPATATTSASTATWPVAASANATTLPAARRKQKAKHKASLGLS